MESLNSLKKGLSEVAEHKPTHLLAVFHPNEPIETGQDILSELSMALYYWKETEGNSPFCTCTFRISLFRETPGL